MAPRRHPLMTVAVVVLAFFGSAGLGLALARPAWMVASLYRVVATAYGATLWGLARHGYLPFPGSD